jgi:hypothetical protein
MAETTIQTMLGVEDIKIALVQLPMPELLDFRSWFRQFEASLWDRQIEADVSAGKLDWLAAEALADFDAGRCTEL